MMLNIPYSLQQYLKNTEFISSFPALGYLEPKTKAHGLGILLIEVDKKLEGCLMAIGAQLEILNIIRKVQEGITKGLIYGLEIYNESYMKIFISGSFRHH